MKTNKLYTIFRFVLSVCCLFSYSCKDFLDVVPDNTATIQNAFKNRYEAERFMYGCFGFLPATADGSYQPAIIGGDEAWYIENASSIFSISMWNIARGYQNATAPLFNCWSSEQATSSGPPLFTGLSDCNVFLENIHLPFDMEDEERKRMTAEVKFLKAYFHFYLMRMYGPIPLIKENLPITAQGEEAQRYREPIDDVVDYIVELLDEAVGDLPVSIVDEQRELGRPTQAIALAVKTQVLLWAASPLLNGTADKAPEFSLIDKRGIELFPQSYDALKWQKAADAAKEAIDAAIAGKHELFDFRGAYPGKAALMNDASILAMQVRGAMTERWNKEIIWGDSRGGETQALQRAAHPVFLTVQENNHFYKLYAPTLRIVEQFYTANGLPIEEDADWEGVDPYGLQTGTEEHKYHVQPGYETVNLHFNREARFYGSISFDGGWYFGGTKANNDNDQWPITLRYGKVGGGPVPLSRHPSTAILCKKVLNIGTTASTTNATMSTRNYAYPLIRLADVYLMYAEALNEAGSGTPHADVYTYVDKVRTRTGLKGVVESWRDHAVVGKENKPLTKEGMREIIRRERLNELAFESHRFWDLRRWMLAEEYMNDPIRGWDIRAIGAKDFYTVTELFKPKFEKKDYFWPIQLNTLLRNNKLIQNPGWE